MALVQESNLFLSLRSISYSLLGANVASLFSSKLKINLIFCRYLLLLSTSIFSTQALHANELNDQVDSHFNVATIDFVKGYATIFPGNDIALALFAKRGMKIIENDRIITGDDGFLSLSFSSGAVVNIQPLSEINMELIDCKKHSTRCRLVLKAIKGDLNADVESQNGYNTQFTIETPYASAAVRGTVFDIDVNETRLLAGVTEGQVDVNSELGTVELPENFGTQVQEDQPPATPKPLLAAPTILQGPPRYDKEGELAWSSVASAANYLISLNTESGLVYSKAVTDTLHRLQTLNVGTYVAQVRAIDEDGFKGRTAEREFDVVEIDNSVPGPILTTTIEDTDFSIEVEPSNAAADRVELHFSPTKDFEKLLYLDVSTGEPVSTDRADNVIYVRGRSILSNTKVTPFGPIVEVPGTN